MLIKPPCSNTSAQQIAKMNIANKNATNLITITDMVQNAHINSSLIDSYETLLMNQSSEYYHVHEMQPDTLVAKQAILESIHYEFLVGILWYTMVDHKMALKLAIRIENKAQAWRIDNLKDFLEGDALDAELKIRDFGTFRNSSGGYSEFEGLDGNYIRLGEKSAC